MGETGCYRCTGQERFEGAICDGCGSVADGRGGVEWVEPVLAAGPPAWLVWDGESDDRQGSLDAAIIRFDAILQELEDDARSDGEWPDVADNAPELWVAYPLRLHTLVPDVDEDGSEVSRSEVVEYADPVAVITAERDQLLAERARPSAASIALDRLAERFPREALAPGISSPSWDDLVDWALAVVRERDEARAALARIYVESGADPDGNDPATENGIAHLWPKAEAAVRELRRDHRDISGLVEQYEKYTEILCPDCGAPTDGLPDGWPAS